jgi:hypothetical protein
MSLQFGDDDDDLFDSTDEDEEESENDLSSDAAPIRPRQSPMQTAARSAGKRRMRVRPMTPSMASKHPDVVTILLTRSNGQQLIFVRK